MTAQQPEANAPILLRRPDVCRMTGLTTSVLYAKLTRNPRRPWEYDPSFPRPIKTGPRRVAWVKAEIDAWVAGKLAERDRRVAAELEASDAEDAALKLQRTTYEEGIERGVELERKRAENVRRQAVQDERRRAMRAQKYWETGE